MIRPIDRTIASTPTFFPIFLPGTYLFHIPTAKLLIAAETVEVLEEVEVEVKAEEEEEEEEEGVTSIVPSAVDSVVRTVVGTVVMP